MTEVDFFCKVCSLDQRLPAIKRGTTIYNNEWWYSRCVKCSKDVIRYITEKKRDPYYWTSLELRRQRHLMADDLIQRNDSKYQTHYREQWLQDEKDNEKRYNDEKKDEASRDEFYDNSPNKQWAKETINVAEKIANDEYKKLSEERILDEWQKKQ